MNSNPLWAPSRTKDLILWLSQIIAARNKEEPHTLNPPWNRAAQTNSAASLMPTAREKQPPPSPAPQSSRAIAKANCWASKGSKHRRAGFSQSSSGKGDARKLTTGCLQCSLAAAAAAAQLHIPYLLQVKSGPMGMNCTPEGHQLKLRTSKEAKKGKGMWLLGCYGTGGC